MDVFPDTNTLLLFIATSVALLVVPGPAVLYIVARSIERGWGVGVVSALGLAVGAIIHIFLATIGVAALIQSSPVAFSVIRLGGAGYIVYLGVQMIRKGKQNAQSINSSSDTTWQIFQQATIVNLSNPKAMLFFFAFLPQFVDPLRGAVAAQMMVLGGIFLLFAFVNDTSWAVVAGWAGGWLRRKPSLSAAQHYAGGFILIALGLVAAVAQM